MTWTSLITLTLTLNHININRKYIDMRLCVLFYDILYMIYIYTANCQELIIAALPRREVNHCVSSVFKGASIGAMLLGRTRGRQWHWTANTWRLVYRNFGCCFMFLLGSAPQRYWALGIASLIWSCTLRNTYSSTSELSIAGTWFCFRELQMAFVACELCVCCSVAAFVFAGPMHLGQSMPTPSWSSVLWMGIALMMRNRNIRSTPRNKTSWRHSGVSSMETGGIVQHRGWFTIVPWAASVVAGLWSNWRQRPSFCTLLWWWGPVQRHQRWQDGWGVVQHPSGSW